VDVEFGRFHDAIEHAGISEPVLAEALAGPVAAEGHDPGREISHIAFRCG
jgi:hypothetical protein